MKFDWLNSSRHQTALTVGRVLDVSLPELGIPIITAKVDTGAFSGSLHAHDIRVVKTTDNTRQLQFKPYGSKREVVTIDKYHRRNVKSSNGVAVDRYAFETTIEILGRDYPIVISLSDRSSMRYQMLIGRKFLKTHGILVDVSLNNQ